MNATPAPWFAVNDGTRDAPMMVVKAARIAGRTPQHCVAIVATGDSPQAMEDANANLIAAAPEMHAILDELENQFDDAIFPEQKKEDFDAPDDREYSVTITAKQWRAINRALSKANQQ